MPGEYKWYLIATCLSSVNLALSIFIGTLMQVNKYVLSCLAGFKFSVVRFVKQVLESLTTF